jgi:hypothetical protein
VRHGVTSGDEAINIQESIELLPVGQLHKKDEDIDRNDDTVDNRIGLRPDGIANRDHNYSRISRSGKG